MGKHLKNLKHAAARDESKDRTDFPIVGIGASAGGLSAFEAFFSALPPRMMTGMAFVLVQHLAPDHKSMLAELVRRYTSMHVCEVEDGVRVQPDCVYIIPPNRDMAFLNGTLQLLEPTVSRGIRLPIDFFFRSLAQDQRERAIGIILAGTGCDGTLGVRAIKGEGGMVMVQTPESTEFDGMPRSAMATGLMDFVLPPAEMPLQLISYVAHAFGKLGPQAPWVEQKPDDCLNKIFVLLRNQTGHDFSLYKPKTILRRIERRMAVHQVATLEEYVHFLGRTPIELETLFHDFLIGVTSFFRDPQAFHVLEESVIPALFAGRSPGSAIRVWCPACSTGEEAYSLSILLQEQIERLKQGFKVQVFATDIDRQAIEHARAGVYSAGIASDVTPERLSRFFMLQSDSGTYRINKSIRDNLIFSEQDILKDPPFSKLDLICCRNLLIYLAGEPQKMLIPMFHYALNPGGHLFLGTSESIGDFLELFVTLDRKAKLYQRREVGPRMERQVTFGFPRRIPRDDTPPLPLDPLRKENKKRLQELTEQALLQHIALGAALITEMGEILYLHGRTGKFLEPAPGEAGMNILKMAREGLRSELATAFRKTKTTQEPVVTRGVRVRSNGDFTLLDLTLRRVPSAPQASGGGMLYAVIFEEQPMNLPEPTPHLPEVPSASSAQEEDDSRINDLKRQLIAKEESLRSINEELETSNEELRSSNEEMQSINEELQSTNEELETSKEELQSVNEELATVNTELQTKVLEFARANNDMSNLLAGTGIGTIFVDHQLLIKRFTPVVTQVINLISTDVGRPVGHLVSNLAGYNSLVDDVQAVLDTLVPKEIEVATIKGAWYLLRIRPYRTLENVIEGAVITFVDITEIKRAQERRQEIEAKYRIVVETIAQGVLFLNREGVICDANPSAERIFGASRGELHGFAIDDGRWQTRFEDGSPVAGEKHPAKVVLASGQPIRDCVLGIHPLHDGLPTWVRLSAFVSSKTKETEPLQLSIILDEIPAPSTGKRQDISR